MAAKELIQTVTLSSTGTTSITFSSIPQTYTDLYVVLSLRAGAGTATDPTLVRFNGSTSGYGYKNIFQITSTVYSTSGLSNGIQTNGGDSAANMFGTAQIYVPNYAGASNKTWSSESAAEQNTTTGVFLSISAGSWANTAAITSITFASYNDLAFQAGSTMSLYGFNKGSDGITTVA
jgi:hypothetical protein